MTRRTAIVAACLAATTGCTKPSSLSGRVTLDGAPLPGATVVMTPEAKGAELVVGSTQPDGRFVITPAAGRAIEYGKYKVTVSKREDLTPAQMAAFAHAKELLPEKYSVLSKTLLSLEVPAPSDIEFALTSK